MKGKGFGVVGNIKFKGKGSGACVVVVGKRLNGNGGGIVVVVVVVGKRLNGKAGADVVCR